MNSNRIKFAIWPALALAAMSVAQEPKNCASLAGMRIPGVEITKAAPLPAADSVANKPGAPRGYSGPLPAYCRVEGTMNRRTGVDGQAFGIGFALALPENWNGDFAMQGGGGGNGIIYEPLGTVAAGDVPALARGFAVATNDTGHKSKTGPFDFSFSKDQQAVLDFDYLANAEVAGVAKQIIAAYYSKPAAYSYFLGCSTGGREGMILSQRWPTVFNGIVSGDPAMRTGLSNLAVGPWTAVAYNKIAPKDASSKPLVAEAITDSDRKLVIDALLKECDALDGVADGMIFNPTACHFDPAELTCQNGQTASCLPAEKAGAIEQVFAGPKNSHGDQVYPGYLYDTGVTAVSGPGLLHPGTGLFGPPSTAMTLDVDQLALKASNPLADPMSTNLTTFQANGGKLIFYHGDSDPWFSPLDTLGYYKDMAAANGGLDKVLTWSQMYLVPGMGHCGGGAAALDKFDLLGAIVDWTEKGKIPESVTATGQAFPGRSRPLCAYPRHAQYTGTGDSEDARNFRCE
jgi:feruloyl esterase